MIEHWCEEGGGATSSGPYWRPETQVMPAGWYMKGLGRRVDFCPYCGVKLEAPQESGIKKFLRGRLIRDVKHDVDKLTIWFVDGARLTVLARETAIANRPMLYLEMKHGIAPEPPDVKIEVSKAELLAFARILREYLAPLMGTHTAGPRAVADALELLAND